MAAWLWACGAAAGVAQTENPLSAIDWLTQTPADPVGLGSGEAQTANAIVMTPIDVAPLQSTGGYNVGLLDPQAMGFASDFWRDVTADDIVIPTQVPLPVLANLRARLILAQGAVSADVVVRRLDAAFASGSLDAAWVMARSVAAKDPALFNRAMDIAVLSGHAHDACALWSDHRAITSDPMVRVVCLSLVNDWDAAATVFVAHETLGDFNDADAALLAAHLDPEMAGNAPAPTFSTADMTPLRYWLVESAGLPRPTQDLGLPYAHAQLAESSGWKSRLEAAERLIRAGSIPANQLLGLYTERRPAASGGVWDRAAAVQNLRRGFAAGSLSAADLDRAWADLSAANLAGPIAVAFKDQWAADMFDDPPPASLVRFALMAGLGTLADDGTPVWGTVRLQNVDPTTLAAVQAGQTGQPSQNRLRAPDVAAILALGGRAANGDLTALTQAMTQLTAHGQTTLAHQLAIEFMLDQTDP
ncbi:MAG: hypothetical protein AAF386_06275 [Pseudomonadota bacterium]